ncbi:hypothetical protein WMY93_005408 [Mugilogobius chulae]|uniref:Acid ceramidase n=1 Tax=Mugilogobius chulae TaxID=88201 RepID=A0AAW0PW38_9GOBI
MARFCILCLIAFISVTSAQFIPPYTEDCRTDMYPPKGPTFKGTVSWYTIDLDLPPHKRWTSLITEKKKDLDNMIQVIRDLAKAFVPSGRLIELVDVTLPLMVNTLPNPFKDEIKGIALDSGIPLGEITLFNIFYEVFTVCTSVVAEDSKGNLLHGRNLDFGLFMGHPRVDSGQRDGMWMSFLTRSVLENATSYDNARYALAQTKLLAPAYFILGGNQSGQGCIITRSRELSLDLLELNVKLGRWYVLETNYDHWEEPFFLDDRRTPAMTCMNKTTQTNISIKTLYDMLSTKPVLNKLTTYTTLMQVSEGTLESYIRDCPNPCMPW